MTDEQYRAIMGTLIDAYPDTQAPDKNRRPVYRAAFRHLPADVFAAAVKQAIGDLKFFPTVSELREFARSYMQITGMVPTSGIAWEQARRACNGYVPGIRETIDYPTPLIGEAVRRMGGPRTIAHCAIEQLDWKRKEFQAIYDDLALSADAIGIAIGAGPPRYKRVYGAYMVVDGEYIGQGEPRILDTHTGRVVAPEFMRVQELADARLLAERAGTGTDGGTDAFRPFDAGGGGAGERNPRAIPRTTGGRDQSGDV